MKTYQSLFLQLTCAIVAGVGFGVARQAAAQPYVFLTDVPDYDWYAGCFGTGSGNLAGYWDRHGFSNVYNGPVNGGVAPLSSRGENEAIQWMWASPAHMGDYYLDYAYPGPDPFVTSGRREHSPDCIGDFIGLSQNKWSNLAGECRGNIDAYSFVFWDKTGNRRLNHYTYATNGVYVPDIGSGLKEWMRWRGYDADVTTQLTIFNPERTTAAGFTYQDVKREIDAGYPVLCFLQPAGSYSRPSGVNPEIHGVMIFGYYSDEFTGVNDGVMIKTSWGTGFDPENPGLAAQRWNSAAWLGLFPVRGVITFRPKPKIRTIQHDRTTGKVTLTWEGPTSYLQDHIAGTVSEPLQKFVVQRATSLSLADWKNLAGPTTDRTVSVDAPNSAAFYRVVVQP